VDLLHAASPTDTSDVTSLNPDAMTRLSGAITVFGLPSS